MAGNESTLRLGLEYREIETGLNKVIGRLGGLNDATNNADKKLDNLEKSLTRAAGRAGMLDQQTSGAGKSITGMAGSTSRAGQAIAKYEAQVKQAADATARLNQIKQAQNGSYRDSANGGKFVSKAEVAELQNLAAQGQRAQAALKALNDERQRGLSTAASTHNQQQIANARAGTLRPATPIGAPQAAPVVAASGAIVTAAGRATNAIDQLDRRAGHIDGLATMRYALYDASATLGIFGAAVLGAALAPVATAIQYQRNFADVLRTVSFEGENAAAQAEALKQSFMDLASEIPVSFEQLTKIGTLGGQLDIPAAALDEFAQTVAMFSATTNVSVEETAESFGRLAALLKLDVGAGQLENLSSAIFKVGVTSVATEKDVITISTQIASMGKFAGLSAAEVVALSGTLASVGIRPELSRGIITRAFTLISEAVSDGGEKLETFGRISGKSGAEFANAWKGDALGAFATLLEGINAQGDGSVAALKELGIAASRDIPSILKLAQNTDILYKLVENSDEAFKDGTATMDAFGNISGTVAAKLQVLQNNFGNFLSTVGGGTLGPLSGSLDLLNGALSGLSDLLNDPIAATILGIFIAFSTLVGVIALVAAGLAAGTASLLAFQLVAQQVATTSGGTAFSVASLNAALIATGPAGAKAAAALRIVSAAMKGAAIAGAIFVAVEIGQALDGWARSASGAAPGIEKLTNLLKDGKGDVEELGKAFGNDAYNKFSFAGLNDSAGKFRTLMGGLGSDFANFQADFENSWLGSNLRVGSFGVLDSGLGATKQNLQDLDEVLSSMAGQGKVADVYAAIKQVAGIIGVPKTELLESLEGTKSALEGVGVSGQQAVIGINAVGDASVAATPDIEQLGDYVDDLISTLFGTQDATAAFYQAMDDARAAIAGIKEEDIDTSTLIDQNGQFVLSIQAARDAYAEVRDVSTTALERAKELYDGTAQGAAAANAALGEGATGVRELGESLGLSGALLDTFVEKYTTSPSEFQVLVNMTGQEEVEQRLDQISNPRQADYYASTAPGPLLRTKGELDDTANPGGKPRLADIEPKLDGAPKAKGDLDDVALPGGSGRNAPINVQPLNLPGANADIDAVANKDRTAYIRVVPNSSPFQLPVATGGLISAYARGGYHKGAGMVHGPGTGTSDSINARLSDGEFVQRAAAVRYYGADFMSALNSMQIPKYALGGAVGGGSGSGGGSGVMELGPRSLRVLREAVTREVVARVDYVEASRATETGNKIRKNMGDL